MGDFITDLKKLMEDGAVDRIKARLEKLDQRPEEDQNGVIEQLALANDNTALDLIPYLMAETDPDHPVHARLFQLATDRAHLNYAFVLVLLDHASRDQLDQVIPLLRYILAKETKGDILNLILRQIGKLKLDALVDDVAEFIFYDDAGLKREAVKALERTETPDALKRLEQVAATDKCDLDVLDAIDMLKDKITPSESAEPEVTEPAGDQAELGRNAELLAAERLEDRANAFAYFSDQGARVTQALHDHMDTPNPDLLVNLIRLAGRTIPQDCLGDLLSLAARKDTDNSIKFSVYSALALFPRLESAAAILNAATDSAMYIRMAAVKALDRHCSDYVVAEIKKKIESGTKIGETLGVTILDARAANLIDALMNSDTFSYISSNYLERSAPVRVLDTYIRVLEKRNRRSTVKKYTRLRQERAGGESPVVVVIHPSSSYLDVYAKLLHGCGFRAKPFAGLQDAFEFIVSQKPAAVICDLFVRQLTALDLAREIRELYTKEEVPIIVSSLQKTLDRDGLAEALEQGGINGFYPFPAKPSQIRTWAGSQ